MLMTKEAAIKEAMQPETPERPRVKIEKIDRTVMLEDVLALMFDTIKDYDLNGGCGADDCMAYLAGVMDAFEAMHGPIIR